MNVTPNEQALALANPAFPVRKPRPDLVSARELTGDSGRRKHLAVVASSPDTTVVFVRTDYFTRTGAKEGTTITDASYSNSTLSRRDTQPESSSADRQLSAQSNLASSSPGAIALYTRVQGAFASHKGTHIDVFV